MHNNGCDAETVDPFEVSLTPVSLVDDGGGEADIRVDLWTTCCPDFVDDPDDCDEARWRFVVTMTGWKDVAELIDPLAA